MYVKTISLMIRSRFSGQSFYHADGMTKNQKTTINTVSPATNAAFNLCSNVSGISMVHLLFHKDRLVLTLNIFFVGRYVVVYSKGFFSEEIHLIIYLKKLFSSSVNPMYYTFF